jgi:dsRNA-specific ribonuclease
MVMSMEENRKEQLKNFMGKKFVIEIDDKYIEDYNQALTHYNDDRLKGTRKPERLAFLGDAYLEFIVREYLFNHKDNFSLEEMNDLKKPLVENDDGWKKIAEEIGLGEQIVTVQHDKLVEDKIKDRTILARSYEALAAVLSYDSSLVDDPKEKLIDLFIKLRYLSK